MAFSLQNFKTQAIQAGGYRPALFEVVATSFPEEFRFLCMSSQVPAATHGVIEVPYFGRKVKIAGDRTYAEWTTTLMIEEDFSVRNSLEEWADQINDPTTGVRTFGGPEDYKSDLEIKLYGKNGDVKRSYKLVDCWPTDVGTIELDWNTTDTIGTYTVTWAFDEMAAGS